MKKVFLLVSLALVLGLVMGCPQPNDSGSGSSGGNGNGNGNVGGNTGVNVGSLTLDDVKAIVNNPSYDGQDGIDDIRTLLTGDDIDAQDSDGWTALLIASYSNLTDIAIALINASANVNHQFHLSGGAEYGENVAETALHIASYTGNLLLVRALIEARAVVEVMVLPGGETALYFAVVENHPDVVEVLIEAGANYNYFNATRRNTTLLMYAIQRDAGIEVVRLLINAGAYKNRTDTTGKTALDYANEKPNADGSYDEIIALLEEASA